MENAAATAAVTAATAAPNFTSTPPQRQDDINILALFYHVTDTEEGTGVVEHIVRFMSSSTEVLLFANAFPLISNQLVHAYENAASFNGGWEIIIGSPIIIDQEDDMSIETHEYDTYDDTSDVDSIPPTPPPTPPPSDTSAARLASRINDRIIYRMLVSLSRCINKPLKLLSIRDCVHVDGSGLKPLRYLDFTQVEYVNLKSLTTRHHGGLASTVMSILIDILPACVKLKYLELPDGWLGVFPRQFDCVGDCCSEQRLRTCAREWCHRCGSGPYCESSNSLVECKKTGEKFCKGICARGDSGGDPRWDDENAAGCPIQSCDKWHCLCGCNDWRTTQCIGCNSFFHCCLKKCDNCQYYVCKYCYEDSHYNAVCSGECEICDYQYHTSEIEYCRYCNKHICRDCDAGHREECLAEFNERNDVMRD
jgi:hypothetical protein